MWYAAHVIMRYRYADTSTDSLVGYENVFLVKADSPAAAIERARELGSDDEIRTEGSSLNGRRAHLIMIGVKKVVECLLTPGSPELLSDGDEITYNELVAKSESDFASFVRGEFAEIEIA